MENNAIHGEKVRQDILEYIKQYIRQHSYPPSRREIGDGVGLKSTASVQSHINRMLSEGILETDVEAGSPRALRVPGMRIVVQDHRNYMGGHEATEKMTVLEYLERRKIDDKKQIRLPGPYLRASIARDQAGGEYKGARKAVRRKARRYCVHKSGGKRRWETDRQGEPSNAGR